MQALSGFFTALFGLGIEAKDLTALQLSARGVVILFAAIILVRVGAKRAMARKTPLDMVMIVIVGSLLSRSINGSGPLFGTIAASFVIVVLHRLLELLAYSSHPLGVAMKGAPGVVVEDGQYVEKTLRQNHITRRDVEEDLRLDGTTEDIGKVRIARVERSGDISFLYKKEDE
ncbi:MAG TPA: YetF domain-containing protein [Chthoniobacterales bacterium]|nr:YetF domain-containing protein [Chthoniobacterales bacterium]